MLRALVIEDDADNRDAVADCLAELAGLAVEKARDGAEGFERLREGGADLIVIDLLMPGMSGQGFVERCRSTRALADIPILVITAMIDAEVHGATARLDKPFDVEQLLGAVRFCLGLPRAGAELRRPDHAS